MKVRLGQVSTATSTSRVLKKQLSQYIFFCVCKHHIKNLTTRGPKGGYTKEDRQTTKHVWLTKLPDQYNNNNNNNNKKKQVQILKC